MHKFSFDFDKKSVRKGRKGHCSSSVKEKKCGQWHSFMRSSVQEGKRQDEPQDIFGRVSASAD